MLRSRMLSRVVASRPAASSADGVHRSGSVGFGECPAEAVSSRATATATIVRACRGGCRVAARRGADDVRLPGDLDDMRGLSVLAAAQRLALRRCAAVVPGGLDQSRRACPRPGLRDRALPAFLATGVLGGSQADVAHQLPRLGEPLELADLRAQADRGERRSRAGSATWRRSVPTASRGSARRSSSPARRGGSRSRRSRRLLQQRDLRAALSRGRSCQPRTVADRPRAGGVLIADVVGAAAACQPLAGAPSIAADSLPGAHDIAQRLLLCGRDPDRVQPVDHQQAQHPLGVALIVLTLSASRSIPRAATTHPPRSRAGPARDRSRSGRPRTHFVSDPATTSTTRRPRAVVPDSRRERSSPTPRRHHSEHRTRVHIRPTHCEPSPWSAPLCGCGRRAGCHP